MNDASLPRFPSHRLPHLLHLLLLFFLLAMAGCQSSPVAERADENAHRSLAVDGHLVPVFATPEEQLTYARSSFDEVPEKRAALKAIELIHPAARPYAAMAALELAFLELGDDYRQAGGDQCTLAKINYLELLEKYSDLPAIAAKALWYLGWISCDLQDDNQQGIAYYQRLIALYPNEILSFLAPAPWLTIHPAAPDKSQPAAYPKAELTWADIAHLEIIRNTSAREQAWQSFTAIQQAGGDEVFKASALKILVARHGFEPKSEELTRAYLAQPAADAALQNDLLLALSAYRRTAPPATSSAGGAR